MGEHAIWEAEGAQKRTQVQRMFAEIAPTYDRVNGLMSMSLHHRWRRAAVALLNLNPGDQVVDVCCGTGDFMIPLREAVGPGGRVVGVDFCRPMLDEASVKVGPAPLAVADACDLPIRSGSFDAVSVGWGIRNVADIPRAHRELARILRPGGRMVSLDMAVPKNRAVAFVSSVMFRTLVPMLGRLYGKAEAYTYLPRSTERFAGRTEQEDSMRAAGFVETGHRDLFFGNICIHWGRKG